MKKKLLSVVLAATMAVGLEAAAVPETMRRSPQDLQAAAIKLLR